MKNMLILMILYMLILEEICLGKREKLITVNK